MLQRLRHSAAYRRMSVEERWRSCFVQHGECWLWLGVPNKSGYGTLKVSGRTVLAHRFGYELLVGPIPDGLELDHGCRVRICVNPTHLEPVTTKVNILRGFGRGAIEARMTHCLNGHPLNGENLYIRPADGKRRCRQCNREKAKQWRDNKVRDYQPVVET